MIETNSIVLEHICPTYSFGVFESLDDNRSNTIGTAVSISGRVPGFACIVALGQEITVAQTCEAVGIRQDVHTPCNSSVNLPIPQSLTGDLISCQ